MKRREAMRDMEGKRKGDGWGSKGERLLGSLRRGSLLEEGKIKGSMGAGVPGCLRAAEKDSGEGKGMECLHLQKAMRLLGEGRSGLETRVDFDDDLVENASSEGEKRQWKRGSYLGIANSYLIDSPSPSNITYWWGFGSLLGVVLVMQIVTGVTLGMHYTGSIEMAFNSVEHIMRDVNNGYVIRYLHANVASWFFIFLYLHIARGLYYGSYSRPRQLLWSIGVIIFVITIVTAFLGYTLPWGQMSLWGATVITNLASALPWIGKDLVEFVWGGFSVNNATLNRFYSLHYLMPFMIVGLVVLHLVALHLNGSNNPIGVSANADRLPFHPYYSFKDIVGFIIYFVGVSIIVFYMPNIMGHSDNYEEGNPLVTPSHIQPEWYLLPYYAILRSIPNKLLGVIAMLGAILILLAMPILDRSRLRGAQFRPIMRIMYWVYVWNFVILGWVGGKGVSDPYIIIGQITTIIYFTWFIIIAIIGRAEDYLFRISSYNRLRERGMKKG